MQTIEVQEKGHKIIRKENINTEIILKQNILLDLLCKKDKYGIEISQLEQKYKQQYQSISKQNINEKFNVFEFEDDMMNWEFLISSLRYVDNMIKSLQTD